MKEKRTIVRHSLSQIKAMRERGEDKTSSTAPEAESLGAVSGAAPAWSCQRGKLPFISASTVMSWNGLRPMERGI
jgi:hypothetical protein